MTSPDKRYPPEHPWDEAFLRVESYLLAHHLKSRVQLNGLVTGIIAEARVEWATNPRKEPVAVAMRVTHARVGAWFAAAGMAGPGGEERVGSQRRLALLLADVPRRWAGVFLSPEPVPQDLTTALASVSLQSGPEISFTNMPPAPLEFGFDDTPEPDFHPKPGYALLREAASWLLLIGIYGVAWAAAH